MNFIIYDLVLLAIFVIFISVFLYSRREKVKKEGLLLLYKTSWGIKLIERTGEKYSRLLKVLSYVSIIVGYFLMAGIIYLFGKIVYIYVAMPNLVRSVKVPPIMPLIPYLPQVFKLDFLPSFYFTYWIIILAVIAIPHEFFHGIFAKLNNIKIKTTGFGFFPFFFPVFLAAFVEQDDKMMEKRSKFAQMSVLSAGTFANIITGFIFLIVLGIFFSLAFVPSGAIFNTYAYSIEDTSSIYSINGNFLDNSSAINVLEQMGNSSLANISANGKNYSGIAAFSSDGLQVALYEKSPALENNLSGIIKSINGEKIGSWGDFGIEMIKYSPGENISLVIKEDSEEKTYQITLGENPENKTKAWLGVGYLSSEPSGIIGKMYLMLSKFKEPSTYYQSRFNAADFINDLLWWLIMISFSVAFMNMLPVGIFDGGRFFYLTVWGLTKSKKTAEKTYKFTTYTFLFLVLLIMVFWFKSLF